MMPEKVPMSGVIQISDGGGGAFFVTSPVIGGLTWSDSFALAERTALLPCNSARHGLGRPMGYGLGYQLVWAGPEIVGSECALDGPGLEF